MDRLELDPIALMYEMQEMPGYLLQLQFNSLNHSIFIFEHNYIELRDLILLLTELPAGQNLVALRNRDQLKSVQRHILRCLHNFVAASLSLTDHTRRLYQKLYAPNNSFSEYQERISRDFAKDPLSQFVKGLRIYFQHYKAPDLGILVSYDLQADGTHAEKRTIYLPKEDLLSWSWDPLPQSYLMSQPDHIDIRAVVDEYRDKVFSFYTWFGEQQESIHREVLTEYRQIEHQYMLALLNMRLEIALHDLESGRSSDEEGMLLSIFASSHFQQLESIPFSSPMRPDLLIQMLEKRGEVPYMLKNKIHRVYSHSKFVPVRRVHPDG